MSGSRKDWRDHRGAPQDNTYEGRELEAPPQQIPVYYGDDNNNSRSHGSGWRSNQYHQRDFVDHTLGEQHGYLYGQSANYRNQSYSSWGTGYSVNTYSSQGDHYAPYGCGPSWGPGGAYGQQNHFGTLNDYERPQPRESSNIEVIPRSPSPSYLETSLDSSKEMDPAPRKLVILDLNGTLLVRARLPAHPRHGKPSTPFTRTVHTRPFLASFREYLFHPATKGWLDVMIWSSAQPHSVQDMLRRCFPTPEGTETTSVSQPFIAVWARDTLGLSSIDYSRKTQTIKDLRKPWGQLVPSDNDDLGRKHSALTTLLVDDSPRKACLQPWNHVCVSEYDEATRATEVRALANQAIAKALQDVAPDHQSMTPNAQDVAPNPQNIAPEPQDAESVANSTLSSSLDPTLLAVIGILEALRPQSNVAAWIRAGRLFPERSADSGVITDNHRNAAIAADAKPRPPTSEFASSKAGRVVLLPTAIPPRLRAPRPVLLPTSSASSSPPVCDLPRSPQVTPQDTEFNGSESGPPWFEHAPTFAYWIAQGRAALRDLGIAETGQD